MAKKFAAAEAAAKEAANKSVIRRPSGIGNVPMKKIIKVYGSAIVPLVADGTGKYNEESKIITNGTMLDKTAEITNFKTNRKVIKKKLEVINNMKDATKNNVLLNLEKTFESKNENGKFEKTSLIYKNKPQPVEALKTTNNVQLLLKLNNNSKNEQLSRSKEKDLILLARKKLKENGSVDLKHNEKIKSEITNETSAKTNKIQKQEMSAISDKDSDDKKPLVKKKKLRKKLIIANAAGTLKSDLKSNQITILNNNNEEIKTNKPEKRILLSLTKSKSNLMLRNSEINSLMINSNELNNESILNKVNEPNAQNFVEEDLPLLSISERLRILREKR